MWWCSLLYQRKKSPLKPRESSMQPKRSGKPYDCSVARSTAKRKLGVYETMGVDKARLDKVVASVRSTVNGQPVSGAASPYAQQMAGIFRAYPPELQKLLAKVDVVEFAHGMQTAAETKFTDGKITIKLNAGWVDKGLTSSEFLTWKDRLNFSNATAEPATGQLTDGQYPMVEFGPRQGHVGFVDTLLMHELGHVAEQVLNAYEPFKDVYEAADQKNGAFANRDQLRFYAASSPPIDVSQVDATYQGLAASSSPSH